MAALWKLPIVYVNENNRYAMGTEMSRSARTDFSKRGVSFSIPGEPVDAMDVRAVHAAGQSVIEHARTGKGPYIPEMHTLSLPWSLHVRWYHDVGLKLGITSTVTG